jgi:hypothetical protein
MLFFLKVKLISSGRWRDATSSTETPCLAYLKANSGILLADFFNLPTTGPNGRPFYFGRKELTLSLRSIGIFDILKISSPWLSIIDTVLIPLY